MNKTHSLWTGLAIGLALLTRPAPAQTWQTVDNFQYAAGQDSGNASLAVAPNGTLFAAGWAYGSDGSGHGLIVASADGGNTWSIPVDDFTGGPGNDASYYAVACDPAGNVYAAGVYYDDLGLYPNHWFVRRSTDGGLTWSTVDDFQDGGWFTQPNGLASDPAGNIYVAGVLGANQMWGVRKGVGGLNFATVDSVPTAWLVGAWTVYIHPTAGVFAVGAGPVASTTNKRGQVSTTFGWLVRRSTDNGATWSSVDTFVYSSGYQCIGYGLGADSHGNLYAVGQGQASTGNGAHKITSAHWLIRKSANGGVSWTTVDDFQPAANVGAVATAFAADSNGNLFVTGSSASKWIVRENVGGSGSWTPVDTFQYVAGYWSSPAAITANASGNVFVGGSGSDATGVEHWLVRKH